MSWARQHLYKPCIPTRATKVRAGPDWLHEIKHDGHRLIVARDGDRVRLFTRNGYEVDGARSVPSKALGHRQSHRFPWSALRNRTNS